jgi:hypothetical protein
MAHTHAVLALDDMSLNEPGLGLNDLLQSICPRR